MPRRIFPDESFERYKSGHPETQMPAVKRAMSIADMFQAQALPAVPVVDKPQECYAMHPLLKGKPASYVDAVTVLDQAMDLSNAGSVLSYGSDAQRKIGDLVTDVSNLSNQIVALGTFEMLSEIVKTLRQLDITNFKPKDLGSFWNRKDHTVGDFMRTYTDAESAVHVLLQGVRQRTQSTYDLLRKCDALIATHDDLMLVVEQHVLAGKIVLDRIRKSPFAQTGPLSLVAQFERRISDLDTFQQMMSMAWQQAKLTQSNMVTQIMEASRVIDSMVPIWKSSFSSLIARWQSKGVTQQTPLNQVNDMELDSVMSNNTTLITNLQGVMNDKGAV